MDNGSSIIKKGQVESVRDDTDGLRIKVRIAQDGETPLEEIPYAFPLLPKTFQVVPKEGEGAFVLTTMSGNKESARYYIGPIISQPQFQEKCEYAYGRGNALANIPGGLLSPLEKISNYKETFGSFPKVEDVAMVGRGSQDIIMRCNKVNDSNEVDIRCGIRGSSIYSNARNGEALVGNVVFNQLDPTYIQLKYRKGITTAPKQEANSVLNMVADKINIISNKDENGFNLTDSEELIIESELDDIMSKLHQVPHGDTLVKLLRVIIKAILTHVHPYAGMPPVVSGYVKESAEWLEKLETILSKHVRIS
jgi:hypothetical protein